MAPVWGFIQFSSLIFSSQFNSIFFIKMEKINRNWNVITHFFASFFAQISFQFRYWIETEITDHLSKQHLRYSNFIQNIIWFFFWFFWNVFLIQIFWWDVVFFIFFIFQIFYFSILKNVLDFFWIQMKKLTDCFNDMLNPNFIPISFWCIFN